MRVFTANYTTDRDTWMFVIIHNKVIGPVYDNKYGNGYFMNLDLDNVMRTKQDRTTISFWNNWVDL